MLPVRMAAVMVMVMMVMVIRPGTTTQTSQIFSDKGEKSSVWEWETADQDNGNLDQKIQEWIKKQLDRPVNQLLLDQLVDDMENDRVDDGYWDGFVDQLRMNEEMDDEWGTDEEEEEEEGRTYEEEEGSMEGRMEEEEEEEGRKIILPVLTPPGQENFVTFNELINEYDDDEEEDDDENERLEEEMEDERLTNENDEENLNEGLTNEEIDANIGTMKERLSDDDIDEELIKALVQDFEFQACDENCKGERREPRTATNKRRLLLRKTANDNDEFLSLSETANNNGDMRTQTATYNDELLLLPETANNNEKLLRRMKRSPRRVSRSRSGSSSSSRSRGRSSSSSSSSGGGGWGWGSRSKPSSSSSRPSSSTSRTSTSRTNYGTPSTSRNNYGTPSTSRNNYGSTSTSSGTGVTSSTNINRGPPAGWNTGGTRPGTTYPGTTNPSSGYPGSRPGPGTNYPGSTNPSSGYPGSTNPSSGYPGNTNPSSGYPGSTNPRPSYPGTTNPSPGYPGSRPGTTYPGSTNPSSGYPGARPGYPGSTVPQPGYPGARPGYPGSTVPQPGYPGARPGYPGSTVPQPGYPGARPGYPGSTVPQAGYPGARPGYPGSTVPQAGYPGARPGYPGSTVPQSGYPGSNIQAAPGYPPGSVPFGVYNRPVGPPTSGYGGYGGYGSRTSYPGGFQSYGGYGGGYGGYPRQMGYGAAAGGIMGSRFSPAAFGGYPAGGYPKPVKVKKKGLKNKIKAGIATAATAYAIHKVTKKAKFFSPTHFGGYGYGYGHGMGGFGHGMGGYGMGGFGSRMGGFGYSMGGYGRGLGGFGHGIGGKLAGGLAGVAIAKTGKKLLGAYIKLKIAKYALKFGAEAAKLYFMHKMGVQLDDYMVAKFVHRYHQNRVGGDSRWRYYQHHNQYRRKNGASNDTVQQDDITLGEFCRRPCHANDTRTCQFSFDVHLYQTMSRACYQCSSNDTHCSLPDCIAADGTRRMIVTVNKNLPGPNIEVCAGDKVIVDVMNNHPSMAVSFHWHGLTMAPTESYPGTGRHTPYMDGTSGVSQCPIPPGSGMRYKFYAYNPGTHFWRAQTGVQRGDGLYGPFIVHQSQEKDPNQFLAEHVVVLSDWFHKSQDSLYANQQTSGKLQAPETILINGRGAKVKNEEPKVPPPRFMVENGTRYRLRIMSTASSNCPMIMSITDHELILLAVDGTNVSPVNVSKLLIYPGERYDAMFSAEQAKGEGGDVYWIKIEGGGSCSQLSQYAALQYFPTNFTSEEEIPELPTIPNSTPNPAPELFSGKCETEGQRCLGHLTSSKSLPSYLKRDKVTNTFYLVLTQSLVHNPHYYNLLYYDGSQDEYEDLVRTPQINYLTFRLPPKPLLNNPRPLKSENCTVSAVRTNQCVAGYCECLHTLTVRKGSNVDLVFIADVPPDNPNEPIHLHGYKFWVMGQTWASDLPADPPPPEPPTTTPPPPSENGTTPEPPPPPPPPSLRDKVVEWDRRGELERKLSSPVLKDTVSVPPGGYTIVRFNANNPGVWLLESEVAFQSQGGMALVLNVQGADKDVPKIPPLEFPTC